MKLQCTVTHTIFFFLIYDFSLFSINFNFFFLSFSLSLGYLSHLSSLSLFFSLFNVDFTFF